MISSKLPIGIVGLNFGQHIVEQIVNGPAASYLELAAVCDMVAEKAEDFGVRFGVPAFTNLDDLLAREDIPAVGLFTGPSGRAALLQKIIAAGKDVMTTKPFENDVGAALAVLREAEQKGRIIHLNSPSPLVPPDLAKVQEWREKYNLGRPVGCRADVWANYREKADGRWLDDPDLCPVAPVFRLGIYLINDLIRLMGTPASVQVLSSRIFTERPTADNGQLGILFDNGAIANIYASFCVGDGDHYRNSLTLNFENGTIYRNMGPERSCLEQRSEMAIVIQRDGKRERVEKTTLGEASGLYQWEAFVKAVRGENIGETVTPEQVVAGLSVIQGLKEADRTGQTVNIR